MNSEISREKVFNFAGDIKGPVGRKIYSIIKTPLEFVLSISQLKKEYLRYRGENDPVKLIDFLLKKFYIDYSISNADLENIPKEGPCLVISNHPFGGLEGLILGKVLREIRADAKIMANMILGRIPEFRDLFILVNPYGTLEAQKYNVKAMAKTIKHLKGGNMLGLFPSGDVSTIQLADKGISDPPWNPQIARIARKTGVSVLPIYVNGRNSMFFNISGLLNRRIKTALLPHELFNKRNKTIQIKISKPLKPKEIAKFENDDELIRYLRQRVYMLRDRDNNEERENRRTRHHAVQVSMEQEKGLIKKEIESLPADFRLITQNEFDVICARATHIPFTLEEIGRLREITFRLVGEGTGRGKDLDIYDNYYIHLFLWDREKEIIAGAYRLGLADEILQRFTKKGLYTNTLFKLKEALFSQINPSIELGRSFVRSEYQRSFAPLMLLWKGIGQFIVTNPKYRVLFGPVSINDEYTNTSQSIITEYLKSRHFETRLSRHVRPRTAFRRSFIKRGFDTAQFASLIKDIDGVSDIVSELEGDGKGVPILIKQYLKLEGKLLGFNIDPDFSRVLDGLILVDLLKTDKKILERFMGKGGAEKFLSYNRTSALSLSSQ